MSIRFFVVAMLLNPHAQAAAQAELDAVLVEGHLPDFEDMPSLPYISAIVKEVLRWKPALPIGKLHFPPRLFGSVDSGYRCSACAHRR